MDIVDSQVHFGPGGVNELFARMDALGINAVLADEFWGLDNWGPGYRLANGVLRVTAPTAELAATQHPNCADRRSAQRFEPRETNAVFRGGWEMLKFKSGAP